VGRGRGGLGGGDAGALVFEPAAVLERVAEHGDLFAPVLHAAQALRLGSPA
jgi:hypothetical protein